MKRIIFLIILTVVILLGFSVSIGFSRYVKNKIEGSLAERCPTCEFKIGSLQINPLRGTAIAHFISFVSDPKNTTIVKVKAYHVQLNVDILKLFEHKVEISNVTVKDFKVTVEETYIANEPPAKEEELKQVEESYGGKFLEELPEATVASMTLEDGTLDYTLKKFDREAKLTVSEINAEISPLSTRKNSGPKYIDANLTAKLQKSGQVTFKLSADLFSIENDDKIDIDVQHQNMSELDTFFVNEDGLVMAGEINQIHANVDLTQGTISGDLWANYTDLMLEFKPSPETGALKTAFTNVIQRFKFAKTKPNPGDPAPHAAVLYERLPGQGVVKFILMGLKEAAFKVASN